MSNLEIHLLGGLQVNRAGAPVTGFISSKVPALLAYLAVTGRPHQRETLAGLLWGEMPDASAANNLRQALTNLRKLAGPHVNITRDSVAFDYSAPYSLDVETFRDLLRLSGGQPSNQRAELLRRALTLYEGEFLEGFYVRDAPEFEDWVLVQRVRLRELALQSWDALTTLLLDSGDFSGAVDAAGRLLAMDPWREEAHRQRMLALARSGQFSAAMAQYQTCRDILRREFDAEPSGETTALFERIRAAMRGPRHNLPAATTGFVGRETELANLRRFLASPDTRLVTILGSGGSGKTRLALEAAAQCAPMFLNGVRLVQLASVDTAEGVPWAMADAVGFVPAGAEPPEPQLLNFLRQKELLLVLDNVEHLIEPRVLDLLADILRQAPDVTLLVTSRARLNLSAERLVDLAGLPFPVDQGGSAQGGFPAVQLFAQRSRRVRPDFDLSMETLAPVTRICQMTEGLPLAIELAAAWTRTMTPAEIATELAGDIALLASTAYDVPARHRSMAAVFEHSWVLLDESCQSALAQLSVCCGGFNRAAAQAVAGAGTVTLQTLVDRSLLRADGAGRYDMHPMIREFAAGKLAGRPVDAADAPRRHARYFATQTAGREHEFHGARDRDALQWMLTEADNIRAAWEWGVQQADSDLLEDFLESFLFFFDIQGRYRECVELTGQALEALQSRNPGSAKRALGRLLGLHAAFRFRLGEFEGTRREAERAVDLLEPNRPYRDFGHARLYLGAAWYGLGDLDRALAWFLAAAAAYEEAGHAWGIGAALDNAGFLELLRGNMDAAETHLKRSLEVASQSGTRYLLTGVYDHLAALMSAQGRFAEALSYVERCRAVLDELDRPYIVASLALSLSRIALQAGDLTAAENHVERSLQVARETGNQLDLVQSLLQLGAIATARCNFAAGLAAYQEAAAVAHEIRAESLLVDVVAGLADRAAAMGWTAEAAALYRLVVDHSNASQEAAIRATQSLTSLPAADSGPDAIKTLDEALAVGLKVNAAK
ncbi:MAG: tetratricopeptide repeat protein [Anaerolineae bacterium]|nr:tetratricopeptide repeat protein [Anaerolineae bacterium]